MNAGAIGYSMLFLTVTAPIMHTLPPIGTSTYNAGCTIEAAYEDGSAVAYCPEDGVTYVYDADGNNPPGFVNYTGPRWDAGWYACVDASCLSVDHTRHLEG